MEGGVQPLLKDCLALGSLALVTNRVDVALGPAAVGLVIHRVGTQTRHGEDGRRAARVQCLCTLLDRSELAGQRSVYRAVLSLHP